MTTTTTETTTDWRPTTTATATSVASPTNSPPTRARGNRHRRTGPREAARRRLAATCRRPLMDPDAALDELLDLVDLATSGQLVDARPGGPAGYAGRPTGTETNQHCWDFAGRGGRQVLRLVLRPVTVAAIMTRIAATMMLMIQRIQSMPFVASTPSAAAT